MDILWTHNINTVNTNILIKYLEITAFSDGSIRFRYISKKIYEFVEKEQFFTFDIHKLDKLEKFKLIINNFPNIEILKLDIEQFFIFMNILLKNL